ncbi:unnamed protein product [Orchesella dallaii]|uniref:NADH dehydrogenase [ubiquinone] 1 beta subcomplex subunit 2, mitochondrial n=1 Tax=Orchesella dallaii TaxID=48710 RepID=A0ABP1S548_9HEXA
MIVSRLVPLAVRSSGALKTIGINQQRLISTSIPRQSGGEYSYRSYAPPAKKYVIWAEAAGAFMWWWIFWHLFTDYEHIIGHYPFPDIAAWTDEELGIPPDDAEDP